VINNEGAIAKSEKATSAAGGHDSAALTGVLVDALVHACAAHPRVLSAYLYGSALRSDYSAAQSDLDILVIVDDHTPLAEGQRIVEALVRCDSRLDVTLLRSEEVSLGLHPGWSHHFFFNVDRSGIRIFGPDALLPALSQPIEFREAYRRFIHLCQRSRLVVLNESKAGEAAFWLRKYQRWVPLCLMEFLHLAGSPEDSQQGAHNRFCERFPFAGPHIAYPYFSLEELQGFMERVAQWLPRNSHLFATSVAAPREK
jgi:predicted nucleotidyltransferase